MNYMPKRKKRTRSGIRDGDGPIRCQAHLKWVRGHECAAQDKCDEDVWACHPDIEAAHIRIGTDGSMGKKPGDCYSIPLCTLHHMIQHRIGEQSFEKRYGINMLDIANAMWLRSPAGKRYRLQHKE